MFLAERLARLRQQAAGDAHSAVSAGGLEQRLQRLGIKQQPKSGNQSKSLAELVDGVEISPGLIKIETMYSVSHQHGKFLLEDTVRCGCDLPGWPQTPLEQLLFIDTETTGLSGGSGTLAFLVGMLRYTPNGLRLTQLLLNTISGESDLLQTLLTLTEANDTFVSYNGRRFDFPLLQGRLRLNGLDTYRQEHSHLDLLYPVRAFFSSQWPDCRLATSEQRLLLFEREQDLPGALAPSAWQRWLRTKDGSLMPAVCQHNAWDLLSLFVLLPALSDACIGCYQQSGRMPSLAYRPWTTRFLNLLCD